MQEATEVQHIEMWCPVFILPPEFWMCLLGTGVCRLESLNGTSVQNRHQERTPADTPLSFSRTVRRVLVRELAGKDVSTQGVGDILNGTECHP